MVAQQNRRGTYFGLLVMIAWVFSACSPVDVDAIKWSCMTDDDCGGGQSCFSGVCLSEGAAEQAGVATDEVNIALIAPLTGEMSFGAGLQKGFEAAFAKVNADGGVAGRNLVLKALDDGFSIEGAKAHAESIVKERSALVVVGGVGEGAATVLSEVLNEGKVAYLTLGRGDEVRPPAAQRYLFAPWSGFFFELNTLLVYLERTNKVPARNMALFTEAEGGRLNSHGAQINGILSDQVGRVVPNFLHPAGTEDEQAGVRDTLAWLGSGLVADDEGQVRSAIFLGGQARVNARYVHSVLTAFFSIRRGESDGMEFGLSAAEVTQLRAVDPPLFALPSGMGMNVVLDYLNAQGDVITSAEGAVRALCQDLLATHPLPLVNGSSPAALRFREEMAAIDSEEINDAAFEGWVLAQMIIETLRVQGAELTIESFVDTLERQRFDLGTEYPYQFEPDYRIASSREFTFLSNSKCEWGPVTISGF